MRVDLGLGPASPAASRRRGSVQGPTGFAPVVLGGQPILHGSEPVIVRSGD